MENAEPLLTGLSRCGPAVCPVCGRPNDCQQASSEAYKGPCWCELEEFPPDLSQRIAERDCAQACVCRHCVEQLRETRRSPLFQESDTYVDPVTGRLVFTEDYHRRRGYCCKTRCRHCPWHFGKAAENTPSPGAGKLLLMLITTALSIGAFRLKAEVREEQFSSDPSDRGWVAFGNAELFRWDSEHARLAVTWDTANPTSFFAWPLGTSLQSDADFSVSFELGLLDAAGGIHAGRPGAMQVALGFLNWQRATHEAFQRGAGKAAETLEFNWFPEGTIPGYGVVEPTLSAITFDASSQVKAGFEFPFELAPLVPYRVELDYQGVNRVLTARLTNPGIPSSQVSVSLGSSFGPFALDAFAIMVWDERTSFADSLVAHGWVDDVRIVLPEPPIRNLRIAAADGQSVEFESLVGWSYRLEASYGLIGWSETGTTASGNGGTLRLVDEREILATQQFYRVTAVHN